MVGKQVCPVEDGNDFQSLSPATFIKLEELDFENGLDSANDDSAAHLHRIQEAPIDSRIINRDIDIVNDKDIYCLRGCGSLVPTH